MTTSAEKRVVIASDPAQLSDAVAQRFIRKLAKILEQKPIVHVALTGGSMGASVLASVKSVDERESIDWSRIHFWWGDERFVEENSADRNEQQSRAALLNDIPVPPENIHAVLASDQGVDLDEATNAYAEELQRYATEEHPWPSFDICFLGVGPDGHIASLFPDRREIRVSNKATVAVRHSPKPPANRVSLTRPVLNSSQRVWHVLTGADKASALGLALAGANYSDVPVAGSKGIRSTIFFVDLAAAAQVPPQLIEGDIPGI